MQPLFEPHPKAPPERSALVGALRVSGLVLSLAVAYFIAARISFELVAKPENVAVFWPAAGISAGVMLALGRAAMIPTAIAVVIATVPANLPNGASFALSLVFGIANALESLLIARLLGWWFPEPFTLDNFQKVLAFLIATALGCALSATIAASEIVVAGYGLAAWSSIWLKWFQSDSVGVITIAPLLMSARTIIARPPDRLAAAEGAFVLATLVVAGSWIYLMPNRAGTATALSPAVVIFPLVLWLACRSPPVFTAAASFAISAIVTATLTQGVGRFSDASLSFEDQVLAGQLAIFTASFCALALSSLFEERREAERRLREREDQLYRALDTGLVLAFEWLVDGTKVQRIEITGAEPAARDKLGRIDGWDYVALIHPADRERYIATLRALTPNHPNYTITYRHQPTSDRTVWLEETGTMELAADGSMTRLTGLARDVTDHVHAADRQRLLIDELNHRVKNVLTLISLVIERSRERHNAVDDYVGVLRGRIGAMTRTHTRLSRSGWSGVDLGSIVADELAPFRTSGNATIEGPSLVLKAEAAQAMTLVLHELATNAAKYGALAVASPGTIEVSWRLIGPANQPDRVECLWVETVPGPLPEPDQEGYGTSMIRNLLRHELGGRVELTLSPTGVRCVISLPAQRVLDQPS